MNTHTIKHPATLIPTSDIAALKQRLKCKHPITQKALDKLHAENPITYFTPIVQKIIVNWPPATKIGEEIAIEAAPHAYRFALLYIATNDPKYANKSLEIINQWISTTVSCTGDNAPLVASWSQINFARSMELLLHTYPNISNLFPNIKQRYLKWLDHVMLPAINTPITWKFTNGDIYTNWHCAILEARTQIALLKDDIAAFKEAIATFNTILPIIIETPSYLPNETIYRDVMHGSMSLGSLTNIAELAHHQGVDLYASCSDLLHRAIEAQASVILGHPPPKLPKRLNKVAYYPYAWYIAYNHYAIRKNKPMVNTKALIAQYPIDFSWLFSNATAFTHHTH